MGDVGDFLGWLLPEWGGVLLTGVVVLVAFLVNRFAPKRRRVVRRAAVLLFLYWVATAVRLALDAVSLGGAAHATGTFANLFGIFAAVSALGIVVFELLLPAIRVKVAPIATDVATGAAYVLAALVVLRHAGLELSGIVATSAVVTGILALSLQATLGNVIGGLALQLDDSVRVGDWVQLESGRQARVRQIRWRHTVLETRDWDTLIVPNAALLSAQLLILGKREGQPLLHRMWVYFNVDFRFSPSEVIEAIETSLRAAPIEGVAVTPPPNCVCMDFAKDRRDSFACYAVRYWLTDLAADDPASSRVRERIHAALRRAGIPLAVPAAHIWMEQDSAEVRERKKGADLRRRRAALDAVDLLRPLHEDERASVADRLRFAPFARGEIITRQGSVAHWLYILAEGKVEVRVGSGAEEKVVAEIEAPGFFGEMGLMTGEPRRATVVAKTEVDCYRLDKEAFERIITERPGIAAEISEALAKRSVELEAATEDNDPGSRESRMVEERRKILATVQDFFGLREG